MTGESREESANFPQPDLEVLRLMHINGSGDTTKWREGDLTG